MIVKVGGVFPSQSGKTWHWHCKVCNMRDRAHESKFDALDAWDRHKERPLHWEQVVMGRNGSLSQRLDKILGNSDA